MTEEKSETKKEPVFPGVLHSIGITISVFVIQIIVGIAVATFIILTGLENIDVLLMVGIAAGNLFIAYILLKKTGDRFINLMQEGVNYFKTYLGTVFLIIGSSIVLSEILNYLDLVMDDSIYEELFSFLLDINLITGFIIIVLFPSVLEEIIFRGVILKGLLKNYGDKFAIFFSALLFGIVHLNIQQGITAFFIGLILGWLYWKYRSLPLVIFAHAVNNFLSLLALHYFDMSGYSLEKVEEAHQFQPLWFTIIGLVFLLIGFLICKNKPTYLKKENNQKINF